ncbi:MAG TPA: TonB-dependent receptor, partial [Rhodothermales bacterium]|nr:TonB-dependent receptor [Rhodothermales bacterium]
NTDLAYSTGKTTASLYFNVFGDRLTAVSFGNTPDVYERPSPKLDLIVSHSVRSLKLKLSAKNLLDSPYKETYRFLSKDYTYYEYNTGRSLSLSVGYSF